MNYRVCIPCAGTGSRLAALTHYINKSLVSVANKPTLSHIIEKFPDETEFVIPIGYKGHLVREYLSLVYPDRQFFFEDVYPFEGLGSGLGLTLQRCRQHLQQPFVFISCDTLVEEPIPPPLNNWMGYADVQNLQAYRTITLSPTGVTSVNEKGESTTSSDKAYIGLAGINDYHLFWSSMEHGGLESISTGEAYGMRSLLINNVKANYFTWHDTGNPDSLANTRKHYRAPDEPNILEKANEAIWFVGNTVIKFSDDKNFIANRVSRVNHLQGYVPEVTSAGDHMYLYNKVQGNVLPEVVTIPLFNRLLDFCEAFWKKTRLSEVESEIFRSSCFNFYRNKTLERVRLFYTTFDRLDGTESINGRQMPKLQSLLNTVDWDWLADGLPGRFHGDFHFENILWIPDSDKFLFLDWRQDFAGDLKNGDIYYDFAKLLHGLILSHELISLGHYSVVWRSNSIDFDFHRKQILVECERFFGSWLDANGFDVAKVCILTSLIFLNIAPLHHEPYSDLLYSLGKSMLAEQLDKLNKR